MIDEDDEDDESYAYNLQLEEISKAENLGIPQQQPYQSQQQLKEEEVDAKQSQDSDGEVVSHRPCKRKGKKIVSSDDSDDDNVNVSACALASTKKSTEEEVGTKQSQDSDGGVSHRPRKRKGKKVVCSDDSDDDNNENIDACTVGSKKKSIALNLNDVANVQVSCKRVWPCPSSDQVNGESSSSKKSALRTRVKKVSYKDQESDGSDWKVGSDEESSSDGYSLESTPKGVKSKAKQKNNNNSKESKEENTTPARKSSRLHDKTLSKENKKTPDRRAYLEKISPAGTPSSGIRRKLYSNNLVMGRHTYNTERSYDLIEESDSDDGFIVNDEESEDDEEEEHRKRKRRKKQKAAKSARKVKRMVSSNDSETDEEVCNIEDLGSSSAQNNKTTSLSTRNDIPKEKKTLPKRNKKKHYEKSLEKLRGKRGSNQQEKVRKNVSKLSSSSSSSSSEQDKDRFGEDDDFSSSESDVCQQKSDDGSTSDDDFIDDDNDAIDMSQEEDIDQELKDVISVLKGKKRGKRFQKLPGIEVGKPKAESHHCHISSSDDEGCDDEPILTKTDKQFIDIISKNDLAEATKFLNKTNNAVDKCLTGNKTALHMAAMSGHNDMVELLVNQGANTSTEDTLKYTPLGYAAKNKHPSCFYFLLKKTDIVTFSRSLYKKFKGMNLVHLIVSEALDKRDGVVADTVECLQAVYIFNKKMFLKCLAQTDNDNNTPLRLAVMQDDGEVVAYLLNYIDKKKSKELEFTTEEGGNLLHFAVRHHSPHALPELISELSGLGLDNWDNYGFTPLMYAAELSDECVEVLLNFNANVHVMDKDGVTPLHLAAGKGNLRSIKLLLKAGHKVNCLDKHGWPPLLYANFQSSEDENCVITLFEKNPKQIFCLGHLMNAKNEEQRKKNAKIIQDTLMSISRVDMYYTLFNDFIGQNLSLLDENNHGCFNKTWRMILSFKNKVKWLRQKSQQWCPTYLKVDRSRVLKSALEQLPRNFTFHGLNVTFNNEVGTCLGPKREFCSLLAEELIRPEKRLFVKADGEQYFPLPNSYFLEKMKENPNVNFLSHDERRKSKMICGFDGIIIGDNLSDELLASVDLDNGRINKTQIPKRTLYECASQLDEYLRIMRFVGLFAAQIILDEELHVKLQFSKPFVKQILGIGLNHPEELSEYDHQTYSSIKDNNIDDLDVYFSVAINNPWNGNLEEVELIEGKEDVLVTEENKEEYLSEFSDFKLCTSIAKELEMFQKGFYSAIRKDVINIFTADEFSLLLNGVTKIDMEDWKKNTRLVDGWSSSSPVIEWFWEVVHGLIEEEKSLLLKFATGSPCVPAGGFSELMGLSGPTLFTIARRSDEDKLPEASTCFNRLSLSRYSTKKVLREKLLIAIRHGCEGFAFV